MALLYGAVGACIVGIPLAVLLILQICSSMALKRQVIDYKQLEKQGLYLHVWTLKQDIPAREKVTCMGKHVLYAMWQGWQNMSGMVKMD